MSDNKETRWAIIKDGRAVIAFTSMLAVEISSDSTLPEEPLEKGSFATYNRTLYSDRLTVKLGIEGDEAELQRAQDVLKELKSGTDVFSLATPDYEHKNMTLEGYDYMRDTTAAGGLLVVDLRLKEIREVETTTTVVAVAAASDSAQPGGASKKPLSAKNCKNPANVSTAQTGKTQTAEPSAKQRESIAFKMFGGGA